MARSTSPSSRVTLGAAIRGCADGIQLTEFLIDLGSRPLPVGPVKTYAGCARAHLGGARQRWQPKRNPSRALVASPVVRSRFLCSSQARD